MLDQFQLRDDTLSENLFRSGRRSSIPAQPDAILRSRIVAARRKREALFKAQQEEALLTQGLLVLQANEAFDHYIAVIEADVLEKIQQALKSKTILPYSSFENPEQITQRIKETHASYVQGHKAAPNTPLSDDDLNSYRLVRIEQIKERLEMIKRNSQING